MAQSRWIHKLNDKEYLRIAANIKTGIMPDKHDLRITRGSQLPSIETASSNTIRWIDVVLSIPTAIISS